MAPKVSVILTSFNHGKYISEAIQSVLSQSYRDFELIIWDDASTDDSWDEISSFDDPRIKKFRNQKQRRGIYGLNKTINEVALGKYIAVHHSDDIWELEKLSKQVSFLDNNPGYGAVFSNARAVNETNQPLLDEENFYYSVFSKDNRSRYEWLNYFFYNGNTLCHPSVLIRKECYEKCGTYRYGFAMSADFEMWIRLCLKYEIYILPEKLVRFRVRDDEANSSGNRPEARNRNRIELLKAYECFNNISSANEFFTCFPEAKRFDSSKGFVPEYLTARMAIELLNSDSAKAYGILTLFNLMLDPNKSAEVEEVYNFTYVDFVRLTGENDIFSGEKWIKLHDELFQLRRKNNSNEDELSKFIRINFNALRRRLRLLKRFF